jgi:hypothetical protein
MKVEGTCHCGYVTFAAEIDPGTTAVCHCTDCQVLTGSAFRTVVHTLPGTFTLRSGTPTFYVKTTAESGTKREHAFCPRCGTPIYATSIGPDPKAYSLRLGTLPSRDALVPQRQIWTRSRIAWLDGLGAVHAVEKQG